MKKTLLSLFLLSGCALLPDGSRAVSLDELSSVLETAAGDVRLADVNGDGLIQLDSNSGVPISALEAFVRTADLGLRARDTNGDGMLDSREMLGAAPMLVLRLAAVAGASSPVPAEGDAALELGMVAASIVDRVSMAMSPVGGGS